MLDILHYKEAPEMKPEFFVIVTSTSTQYNSCCHGQVKSLNKILWLEKSSSYLTFTQNRLS